MFWRKREKTDKKLIQFAPENFRTNFSKNFSNKISHKFSNKLPEGFS